MIDKNPVSIGIVGSGTAGLISALIFRKAFPFSDITIVSSSQKGIIGVGEGSTEHWREFMDICDIGVEDLIINAGATHKYGIRFENWNNKNSDYFHSVSGVQDIFAFGIHAEYLKFFEDDKMLTSQTGSIGLVRNQIMKENLHNNTNQFHFDTFKLNDYLTSLCFARSIKFVDDEVVAINTDERENIKSVATKLNGDIAADVWIDASGFSRTLMTMMGNTEFVSFSEYLPCDSAIAFPTEEDTNNQIKPYTRAIACSSGWMWEIPTQERRGNGYVFSSKFLSEEEAVAEAEQVCGYKIEKHRFFQFNPGYLKTQWHKNCIAIGLSSSFVEPLEATSIGATIIQAKTVVAGISSYTPSSVAIQKDYNKTMAETMENLLTMIRLHYVSDRVDTPFWRHMKTVPLNKTLQDLLDIWSERPPSRYDVSHQHNLLFSSRHFAHVVQGQGLVPPEPSTSAMFNMGLRQIVEKQSDAIRVSRYSRELVDHKKALQDTHNADKEYNNHNG